MKRYKIVPNGTECFGEEIAENSGDAMAGFSAHMDSDMNTYFKAVEIGEVVTPYDNPEGAFENLIGLIANGKVYVSDMSKAISLQRIYDGQHPYLREFNRDAFSQILNSMVVNGAKGADYFYRFVLNDVSPVLLDNVCREFLTSGVRYRLENRDIICVPESRDAILEILNDAGVDFHYTKV